MRVELSAERAWRINVDLVVDDRAGLGTLDLPTALIELGNRDSAAGAVLGANPTHVLGEITNLIESVPNGKLKLTHRRARGQNHLHLYQMLLG